MIREIFSFGNSFSRIVVCLLGISLFAGCAAAIAEAQEEAKRKQAEAERARIEAERLKEEAEAKAALEEAARLADSSPVMPSDMSIYFGYDQFTVLPDYTSLLQKHSDYLRANTQITIRLEGNCDERGGREYNLALGARRSEAVKQALSALGISDARIEAISYGKEKPIAFGSDEESYRLNRRVDIVYQ